MTLDCVGFQDLLGAARPIGPRKFSVVAHMGFRVLESLNYSFNKHLSSTNNIPGAVLRGVPLVNRQTASKSVQ